MSEMETKETDSPRTLGWWVWQIAFVLMYPVLVTFSLLFTSILWVFSTLSRLLTFVFKKLSGGAPKA